MIRQHDYELEFRETDEEGRGYVVKRAADGQRLRWQSLPKTDGLESLNVAGVSHRLTALQHHAFAPGQPLVLKPEPENPYDPNAVGVWDAAEKYQVGYLPKEYAAKLAPHLGQGPHIGCMSIWEVREGEKRVALRILLVHEHAKLKGVSFV